VQNTPRTSGAAGIIAADAGAGPASPPRRLLRGAGDGHGHAVRRTRRTPAAGGRRARRTRARRPRAHRSPLRRRVPRSWRHRRALAGRDRLRRAGPGSTFPAVQGGKGPRQMLANLRHVFVGTAAGQAKDLSAAWADEPWDVLLGDTTCFGAGLAAELTDAPWASISMVPLTLPSRDLPPGGLGLTPGRGPLGRARDAALRAVTGGVLDAALRGPYATARRAFGLQGLGPGVAGAPFSPSLRAGGHREPGRATAAGHGPRAPAGRRLPRRRRRSRPQPAHLAAAACCPSRSASP
jgi:hypothetical protein